MKRPVWQIVRDIQSTQGRLTPQYIENRCLGGNPMYDADYAHNRGWEADERRLEELKKELAERKVCSECGGFGEYPQMTPERHNHGRCGKCGGTGEG